MRQRSARSKADLVARRPKSATGDHEMGCRSGVASARADENIVVPGFARYIDRANFADRAPQPGGVGMHARLIGKIFSRDTGRCEF